MSIFFQNIFQFNFLIHSLHCDDLIRKTNNAGDISNLYDLLLDMHCIRAFDFLEGQYLSFGYIVGLHCIRWVSYRKSISYVICKFINQRNSIKIMFNVFRKCLHCLSANKSGKGLALLIFIVTVVRSTVVDFRLIVPRVWLWNSLVLSNKIPKWNFCELICPI